MKKLLWASLIVVFGICCYFAFNFITDDSYSNTPINAINKVRGENFVDYVIHEQPTLDGEVIFFLRNINDDQIVVSYPPVS
ncbi:hypothetical protein J2T13_005352 [Paenibacillus sp. DS2015]